MFEIKQHNNLWYSLAPKKRVNYNLRKLLEKYYFQNKNSKMYKPFIFSDLAREVGLSRQYLSLWKYEKNLLSIVAAGKILIFLFQFIDLEKLFLDFLDNYCCKINPTGADLALNFFISPITALKIKKLRASELKIKVNKSLKKSALLYLFSNFHFEDLERILQLHDILIEEQRFLLGKKTQKEKLKINIFK